MAMDNISHHVRLSGRRHRDLAEALGMTRQAFSDRMHGRTRWTVVEANELALLLGMTLDDLVRGDAA